MQNLSALPPPRSLILYTWMALATYGVVTYIIMQHGERSFQHWYCHQDFFDCPFPFLQEFLKSCKSPCTNNHFRIQQNSNVPIKAIMSPSKFLSFSRHVASRPALQTRLVRLQPLRPFSSSVTRFSSGGNLSTDDSVKTDQFPDSEHATDKKDKLDVQSENSAKGKE